MDDLPVLRIFQPLKVEVIRMSMFRYWGPDLISADRYLGSESDCRSVAQVTRNILLALVQVGSVTVMCAIFILMFGIAGVQLFGGRFGYCLVSSGGSDTVRWAL